MGTPSPMSFEAHPIVLSSGGHQLPSVFSADSPAFSPRPTQRKHRGLVTGVLAGAGVIAALAITQVTANLGYDTADTQYEAAAQTASTTKTDVRAETDILRDATGAGVTILGTEERPIPVPEELEAALIAAVGAGTAATTDADGVLSTAIPTVGTKPFWFWELFGASAELDQLRVDIDGLSEDLRASSTDISDAYEAIAQSGLAVSTAASDATPEFEAAHPSARNDAVIALRNAAAGLAAATTLDDATATGFLSLQQAATQVVTTENEELAEKSGPLMNARLEIEAFARSLAPGVLLDFDWAPTVSGAGFNGSMGGYTTWWWDDPGRATIALSNSVAEQWPAQRSKALVAHEVGHAISVKCQDMYDASTQDSIEKWATAWAISMGFSDDANGVWAYGYPPQNYIDAAAGCR